MNFNDFVNAKRLLVAGFAVALGILLAMTMHWSSETNGNAMAPIASQDRVADIVERHLNAADQQAFEGLGTGLMPIRQFFADARLGTRQFSEEALGWDSKWKLATDYLTGKAEHTRFLEERFSARIFSAAQLEQLVQMSVSAYLRRLDDVDSQLLVNLQADLTNVSPGEVSGIVDVSAIHEVLDSAIKNAVGAVETDFGVMVGRELVSWLTSEVLTVASLELATSSGILSAGFSSGTVTFGVGVIVGIIVDYIVNWTYDQVFDPIGELTKELDQKLMRLETYILTGGGDQPGLEGRLRDYTVLRSQARSVAIKSAILP